MFERFTRRARRVIVQAQVEARSLNHNYIGTEHLLLGLASDPEGVAGRALSRLDLTLDGLRDDVAARVGRGKNELKSGHIPFTPRAKKVLELSLREALHFGHNYIGTEHLLLGVVAEGDGVGAQILRDRAGDLLRVRMAVLEVMPEPLPGRGAEEEGSPRWWRRRASALTGARSQAGAEVTEPVDETGLRGEVEGVRTTPAGAAGLDAAARLAGPRPLGSHHLLLAALADPASAGAQALAGLGLDLEQARTALRDADVTGTSDEAPEEAGRRGLTIRVAGDELIVTATDPVLVEAGLAAIAALGEQDEVIRGDHPGGARLAGAWRELRGGLDDIRRAAGPAPDAPEPGARGEPV